TLREIDREGEEQEAVTGFRIAPPVAHKGHHGLPKERQEGKGAEQRRGRRLPMPMPNCRAAKQMRLRSRGHAELCLVTHKTVGAIPHPRAPPGVGARPVELTTCVTASYEAQSAIGAAAHHIRAGPQS